VSFSEFNKGQAKTGEKKDEKPSKKIKDKDKEAKDNNKDEESKGKDKDKEKDKDKKKKAKPQHVEFTATDLPLTSSKLSNYLLNNKKNIIFIIKIELMIEKLRGVY